MAGMPPMLVARVPSGAQVMTVMGAREAPCAPVSAPQPAYTPRPATAVRAAVTNARRRGRRRPVVLRPVVVMGHEPRARPETGGRSPVDAR
ncbi:hypothetical protein GCM10010315_02260 [Streptomyces luteosporeus]|uniref:Uncharacterized protein n=1 Tax=Streptomyces luteosporeus TaxID=173856 RepID=A0ABP6FZJ2_9ACTN